MTRIRLLLAVAAMLVAVTVAVGACTVEPDEPRSPTPAAGPSAERVRDLLAGARVIERQPDIPGYDRDCGAGDGCVFGTEWTDNTDAPDGHNGCDTRNDVLAGQFTDVDKGTSRCVVQAGTLDDPYSGASIPFRKAQADQVEIDHILSGAGGLISSVTCGLTDDDMSLT
jgi:hypothetical protein